MCVSLDISFQVFDWRPLLALEGLPLPAVLPCCFSFLTGLLSSVKAIFINICLFNGCCFLFFFFVFFCFFHWKDRDWDLLLNHPANITLYMF